MKTLTRIIVAVLIISFPSGLTGQEKNSKLETARFKTSIDCEACVNNIMDNLPKEKGIKNVKCDLETKEVSVIYQKEKTNSEKIRMNLEKLGYTAKPVKETETAEKKEK